MPIPESTCWTVIRAAAAGSRDDRDELARRYLGVVRDYLSDRWRDSTLRKELDDAVQDVFLECFRQGGVLEAASGGRVPSFRAFLYGVVRNVARRFEGRPVRTTGALADVDAGEESLSRLFEKAWARSIMAEAARLQRSAQTLAGKTPSAGSSCCGCDSKTTFPFAPSRNNGASILPGCTTRTHLPARSSRKPSSKSWRSTTPAARPKCNRRRPNS